MPRKIKNVAATLGPEVRQKFSKTPGRCLKGRWGAIYAIECLIILVIHFIGLVFRTVLSKRNGSKAKDEDDEQYQKYKSQYLSNALSAANSSVCFGNGCHKQRCKGTDVWLYVLGTEASERV